MGYNCYLFAEGEVNIGEYSPRRSRGEYSPIFTKINKYKNKFENKFEKIQETKLHAIPHFPTGSFAVHFGDHLQFEIICGLGIICGELQSCNFVASCMPTRFPCDKCYLYPNRGSRSRKKVVWTKIIIKCNLKKKSPSMHVISGYLSTGAHYPERATSIRCLWNGVFTSSFIFR